MKKILFFDDFFIHRQESIKRVFKEPLWDESHAYADKGSQYGVGYSTVVPAAEGGYALYYITVLDSYQGEQRASVLRRTLSSDGMDWSKEASEVLGGFPVPAGCSVYSDKGELDPSKRYKMTNSPVKHIPGGIEEIPSTVLVSPDGLNWKESGGIFLPHHSDTYNSLIWNPVSESYQITARRKWGERRICLLESKDLYTWSGPRTILHPNSLDRPSTHFYGMPQFYSESMDMFVGFLWKQQMPYNKVMGGPITTEYVYSYDGLTWNRTHATGMGLQSLGEFGGGSMYGAALLETDDSLIAYAIARLQEHSDVSTGVLLPGKLRKDGFVCLKTSTGAGEITTECLLLNADELILNVVSPFGPVQAQLCDDAYRPIQGYTYGDHIPLAGDTTRGVLMWRGANLQKIVEQKRWVRLQLKISQCELYSISGDFASAININAPL